MFLKRLVLALVALFVQLSAVALTIGKWQPHNFEFKGNAGTVNPFAISFSAEFTGPSGVKLKLPGFYNGNNTWIVRFSPTATGSWFVKTHADNAGLDNQSLRFDCEQNTNPNLHGVLMVDAAHSHHFIYQDGTHCFPLGYECNWLWALDADDPKLPTVNSFLDKLSSYGFNCILLNAYAYDTSWRPGKSAEDDFGPSALYPWGGTNDQPDFSHFNIAYWQHFDQVIDAMYQRGIMAHLYIKVYNKKVNWPQNNSVEDARYYNWIIARYAAYPNITWDLAKEANNEKSTEYKVARLKFIRAADPYHHLLTVHTDIKTYDSGVYNAVADFRSHQEQSDHLHATTLAQLNQNAWPVANVESGYEYGPKGPSDKTYGHADSPEETARRIWEIQMAGGYNAYYYTYTAWDVIRTGDTPPGYAYLKNFQSFFNQTQYWLLKSADSLVDKGYCLSDFGKEYIVFENQSTSFTLKLALSSKSLKASWYQPFTGQYRAAGTVKSGDNHFTPPPAFGSGPVVLYIRE